VADHPAYRLRPQLNGPRRAVVPYAAMRASDADRERLVEMLKTAFTEGRLTQDEYNLRMEHAYTAKTYGDLDALIVDLPGAATAMPHPPYGAPPFEFRRPNPLAVASLICGLFGITAVPAVILGHRALRQIRVTGEPGRGMAKAGLIMGWSVIGLFTLLIMLAVLFAVLATHNAHAVPTGQIGGGIHLMPVIQHHGGAGPVH